MTEEGGMELYGPLPHNWSHKAANLNEKIQAPCTVLLSRTMNAPGLWREIAADDNLKKHAVQILAAHTSFSPASFHTLHGQFLRTLAAKGDKYVTALNSK